MYKTKLLIACSLILSVSPLLCSDDTDYSGNLLLTAKNPVVHYGDKVEPVTELCLHVVDKGLDENEQELFGSIITSLPVLGFGKETAERNRLAEGHQKFQATLRDGEKAGMTPLALLYGLLDDQLVRLGKKNKESVVKRPSGFTPDRISSEVGSSGGHLLLRNLRGKHALAVLNSYAPFFQFVSRYIEPGLSYCTMESIPVNELTEDAVVSVPILTKDGLCTPCRYDLEESLSRTVFAIDKMEGLTKSAAVLFAKQILTEQRDRINRAKEVLYPSGD